MTPINFPVEPVLVVVPECYGHMAGTYSVERARIDIDSRLSLSSAIGGLGFSLNGVLVSIDRNPVGCRSVDVIEL